ncbi:hypothetical protein D9Q98_001480 [Chlorella vulgaris]|uniref:Uncharacterized protein n=1 Tax=Chlorella vulgaris TaxID=3077 RepID=A0A9D4U066_CHLVU|nr:hypothetical protein D9Q98_001480 [Chlorella vulgaris]
MAEVEAAVAAVPNAQDLLHGVQLELGKRLSLLEHCIQQVAGSQPPQGGMSASDEQNASSSASLQEAAQQEALLQQVLRGAAEQIRDFQCRAEHQAQQVQIEGVLAALKEQHAAEQAHLAAQLEGAVQGRQVLLQQVAALKTARSAAEEAAATWQHRVSDSQIQLEAATAKHAREAEQNRQAAFAAEQQAAAALAALRAQAEAALVAQADRLSLEAAARAAAEAQQAASELEHACALGRQEVAALQAGHRQQQDAWEGQLEALRLQSAEARQLAAVHAAKANAAELRLADLELHAERLGSELGASQQDKGGLAAALQAAERRTAGLAAELQETRAAAGAAQQQMLQELECGAEKLREQVRERHTAEEAHNHQLQRLTGELAARAAEHECTRCALQSVQQALAEQERRAAAADAGLERLEVELSEQVQQVGLLSVRLTELSAAHEEAANAAIREQELAAAAAALLHEQLLEATQRTDMALQELRQVQLGCEAQVQLLQRSHEQQLAEAAKRATTELARHLDAAASASAAAEAEAQQQLAKTAALLQRQCQQLRESAAADAAACGALWSGLCSRLTEQMGQLTDSIALDQALPTTTDAVLPAPADVWCAASASGGCTVCEDSDTATTDEAVFAIAAARLQGGLQHLRGAAHQLRSRYSGALAQLAALQADLAGLKQQVADSAQAGQQRLAAELAQRDADWELRCMEHTGEVVASWQARLAAREEQLQAELVQLTSLLHTSQRTGQQLEQQAATLAAELATAQHAATAALQAAASEAAQQQAAARLQAAEAAEAASERLAVVEAQRRRELEAALAELRQQHASALLAAAERHQSQLEDADRQSVQASQRHQQSLEEARESWEQQSAAEVAHLAHLHAEQCAAAASEHEERLLQLQARHEQEAALLKESVEGLQEGEWQLLAAQAALHARVGELEVAALTAADAAAAQAEEARLAACAAAAEMAAGFQAQLAELAREKSGMLERVAELQGRLGREARPVDVARIAALEAQAADLQEELAATEQRYQRLRRELLLREANYNKTFGAGGAAAAMSVGGAAASQSSLINWMIKAAPGKAGASAVGRPGAGAAPTRLPALGSRRGSGGKPQ